MSQAQKAALFIFCLAIRATVAAAQGDGQPNPENVRMRIGPLLVNPTISLTNIGVDNNVFYESDERRPKRDFTLTVTPASDFWLRLGPSWLNGDVKEDITWYQQYTSERTANTSYGVGWRVPLNRVALRTGVKYANVRDRPGFEIDARSRRVELGYDAIVELRAFSRTSLVLNAGRQRTDFDKNAAFLNTNLQFELNRVSTAYGGGVKYQVTPLTAFTLNASRVEDRFEFSSLRDSDSTGAAFTVTFDPAALIKGSATFGYRDFQPLEPGLEAFKGATAAVNLSYTLLGTTRVGVTATRDIQYSYEISQPYYLQTGYDVLLAQQIFGPIDVVGRFGQQTLAYRDRQGVAAAISNRVDDVVTYGGGVGYHLGRDLRLGVNVNQSRRKSDVAGRQYDDLRIGSSLTYGF